jgi:hypothetical protein
VQHRAHLIGRQINVCLAVIASDKSMSIPVTLDGSFNFIQQIAGMA